MSKLFLYVAETYHTKDTDAEITIKDEITQEELAKLNEAFKVCNLYHSITQIKDIVIENGESYKRYMSKQNLQEISKHHIPPERAVTLANKAVLNYASSIKTYIDMETRILRKKHLKLHQIPLIIYAIPFMTNTQNTDFGLILEIIQCTANSHIRYFKVLLKQDVKSYVLKNTCFNLTIGNTLKRTL